MPAGPIIEALIEVLGAGLEAAAMGGDKKNIGCMVTFIVIIILIIIGVVIYMNTGDDTVIQQTTQT